MKLATMLGVCNMITMSSFKLAKFVNEENQQG
jgi:hypothetical protein